MPVQIDTSAVQKVTDLFQQQNCGRCHQADHDNGPFGHTEQQTTEMITQIY
jgi:cytochrome c551/c552